MTLSGLMDCRAKGLCIFIAIFMFEFVFNSPRSLVTIATYTILQLSLFHYFQILWIQLFHNLSFIILHGGKRKRKSRTEVSKKLKISFGIWKLVHRISEIKSNICLFFITSLFSHLFFIIYYYLEAMHLYLSILSKICWYTSEISPGELYKMIILKSISMLIKNLAVGATLMFKSVKEYGLIHTHTYTHTYIIYIYIYIYIYICVCVCVCVCVCFRARACVCVKKEKEEIYYQLLKY